MTGSVLLPRRELPGWTAAIDGERPARAMYPLGIDATTQSLERKLFDGITSQTPHVVYYAFYAWALTRIRERATSAGMELSAEEFRRLERKWVARLEHVLRAATLLINPGVGGMFGSRAAAVDGPLPPSGRVPLPEGTRFRTTGLGFHLGPLMALRCGDRLEGRRGEFRAGPGAKMLADALEQACRQEEGGDGALKRLLRAAGTDGAAVSAADVHTLAPALALGEVERTSALRAPLVSVMFAHEGPTQARPGTPGWARGQALAVCLEIAEQAAGRLEGSAPAVVRRAILTGYLARGQKHRAHEGYRRTLAALRRLYERHLLQLALYGLWREVVQALKGPPERSLRREQLVALIADHAERSASEGNVARWLGPDPLGASIDTLIARCAAERERRRRQPWNSGEEWLALAVAEGATPRAPSVAAPALALLLSVAEGWMTRTDGGRRRIMFGDWHDEGGRDRLALSVVCGDLRVRSAMSGREYLTWILDAYVVGQSLRATVAKGPQTRSGEYVYFIVPDSGGFRLHHPSRLRSYLQVDSPRLTYGLGMLEELGLITTDPTVDATSSGRRLLKRLHAFHGGVPAK